MPSTINPIRLCGEFIDPHILSNYDLDTQHLQQLSKLSTSLIKKFVAGLSDTDQPVLIPAYT